MGKSWLALSLQNGAVCLFNRRNKTLRGGQKSPTDSVTETSNFQLQDILVPAFHINNKQSLWEPLNDKNEYMN